MPKKQNLLGGLPFTQIPDYFLASVMTELSHSELRVMLYIFLHTLGYGKPSDSISYEQFLKGIVSKDGRRLDSGAGVSRGSLIAALASLERKGLISRQHTNRYSPATITVRLQRPPEAGGCSDNRSTQVDRSADSPVTQPEERLPVDRTNKSKSVQLPATEAAATAGQHNSLLHQSAEVEVKDANSLAGLYITKVRAVQILDNGPDEQDQNLYPTIEPKNHEQKNHDRAEEVEVLLAASISQAVRIITGKVVGISTLDAEKLVKQAFKNGRDEYYIERLVEHVTTSPAIRVPAAVLTTLIKGNSDRTAASQAGGSVNFKGLRASRQPGFSDKGKDRSRLKAAGLDYSKYTQLVNSTGQDYASGQGALIPAGFDSDAVAGAVGVTTGYSAEDYAQAVQPKIDSQLKYSLQDFDGTLVVYVKRLEVTGDTLRIGFIGNYHEPELEAWLPSVKIFYPAVSRIEITS